MIDLTSIESILEEAGVKFHSGNKMIVALSNEQRLLSDTVQRYLDQHYTAEQRRQIMLSEAGWSPDRWRALADIGVFAAMTDELIGGVGGTAADIFTVTEALGGALVVEPVLEAVTAGALLAASSTQAARSVAEGMIAGTQIVTPAIYEFASRFDPLSSSASATVVDEGYLVNGKKVAVGGAPFADWFIVPARASNDEELKLFLVANDDPGVTMDTYTTISGMRAGDVMLQSALLPKDRLLTRGVGAENAIQEAVTRGVIAACVEASVVCRRMCDLTMAFCRNRSQFGQPIAGFQVLQHKMADMFISVQEISAVAQVLADRYDSADSALLKQVSAAKVQLATSCKFVGESAIQLHGAMGMTDEMAIGHYFKRSLALCQYYGDSDFHLREFQAIDEMDVQ